MSQSVAIPFLSKDGQEVLDEIRKIKTNPEFIYAVLNSITEFTWTYTIEDIRFSNNDTECHARISLNIGKKMQGVGDSCPEEVKNLQESAIRNAIENALLKMISHDTGEHVSQPERQEAQEVVKETIPFIQKEKDLVRSELAEPLPEEKPEKKLSTSKANSVFTSRQVEKMLEFKNTFNIMNDEQLLAHLRTWNPQITSKLQLNTTNIEDFFRYVDDLSQEVF